MKTMDNQRAWARRLSHAWLVLTALTLISVGTALAGAGPTGGSTWLAAAVALLTAFIKARQVLDHFLDLRRSTPGWRHFFSGLLLMILFGCFGLHVLAAT